MEVGWTEDDSPNFSFRSPPCSFYSGTKALGEEVLEGAENCYIWRLRIPFNEELSPRNYLQKLLNYDSLLEAENSVSHLDEFCQKCVESLENEVEPGIYNMTNPGSVTTKQVTEWMEEEGVTDKEFQFFEDEEHFMNKAAKTPRSNCVLDTTKAEKAGIGMRPVEEAIRESMQKMARLVASMKNILVTGGLGFIGSNFIRLLSKNGGFETIINFDKQTYAGNPENLRDIEDDESYKFIKADICDGEKVSEVLEEFQIDAIVNFAAESHVDRSIDGPEPFVQTNVGALCDYWKRLSRITTHRARTANPVCVFCMSRPMKCTDH